MAEGEQNWWNRMTAVSNLTAPLASFNHSAACPMTVEDPHAHGRRGPDFLARRSGKTQNWAQFPRPRAIFSPQARPPDYSRT